MISNSSERLSSLQEIVTFLKQKNRLNNIKNNLKYAGFSFYLFGFPSLVQKSPRCILISENLLLDCRACEAQEVQQKKKTNLTKEFPEFIFRLPAANFFCVLLRKTDSRLGLESIRICVTLLNI